MTSIGWNSLESRRSKQLAIIMFKAVHNLSSTRLNSVFETTSSVQSCNATFSFPDRSSTQAGKRSFQYRASVVLASHAVVFRGLVLPPPHKRLLTQAPHSFPIVLLPKHLSQLPSRHSLMTSNQIAGYNGRFRFPRALYSVYSLFNTVLRDAGVKLEYIYIFSLLEWLVMAETPKQISNVNTSASCATF